jgi:hypothetical protein
MKPNLYDQNKEPKKHLGNIGSNPVLGTPSRGERDTSDRFYTLENQGLHGAQGFNAMYPRLTDGQMRRQAQEIRRGLYEGREYLLGQLVVTSDAEVIDIQSNVSTQEVPSVPDSQTEVA